MGILTDQYWKDLAESQAKLKQKVEQDSWRLDYHLMPTTGWMNDPNGLCQFKGVYHFYHQYEPSSPENKQAIHWGHQTSNDLVHFQEEELFLSPDKDYDRDGVYSGSAIIKDGKIHFFYTGNVKHEGDHDYTYSGREQNTVHVVSDGYSIESQEVVIPHASYPNGYTDHIRDPKVFKNGESYYMVLGARTRESEGKILLYHSNDLYQWAYKGVFFGDKFSLGYMWECPDFFELNGQGVLIFSPQGVPEKGFEYQNVYQSGYLLGDVDWSSVTFKEGSKFIELDRGFDFYAPQTFEDEQGRRILFAWMGLGNTSPEYSYPTVTRGWQHAATLPRELVMENGKLRQRPLVEYQQLRLEEEIVHFDGCNGLGILKGEVYELMVDTEGADDFSIFLREDTQISYQNQILTLKHGPSGYGRKYRSIHLTGLAKLQLFMDHSSLEIFVNDGEYAITSRLFPKSNQDRIDFLGSSSLTIRKWNLKKANGK